MFYVLNREFHDYEINSNSQSLECFSISLEKILNWNLYIFQVNLRNSIPNNSRKIITVCSYSRNRDGYIRLFPRSQHIFRTSHFAHYVLWCPCSCCRSFPYFIQVDTKVLFFSMLEVLRNSQNNLHVRLIVDSDSFFLARFFSYSSNS